MDMDDDLECEKISAIIIPCDENHNEFRLHRNKPPNRPGHRPNFGKPQIPALDYVIGTTSP